MVIEASFLANQPLWTPSSGRKKPGTHLGCGANVLHFAQIHCSLAPASARAPHGVSGLKSAPDDPNNGARVKKDL